MRVCQFRHDGNLNCNAAAAFKGRRVRKTNQSIFAARSQPVKPASESYSRAPEAGSRIYPSFAVIEIFAFSTFDTGHPFSAASAYF